MTILFIAAAITIGYLIGSLPTAWLVGRHVMGKDADIRVLGDGNVGATNIGKLVGGRWGTVVGAVDIFKGFLAISVVDGTYRLAVPVEDLGTVSVPGMVAGVSCMTGHIWPVWLRFRGGRGAATAVGIIGAVYIVPVLLLVLPAVLLILVKRNTTMALCLIYYGSLIIAKVADDAEWAPILYCYLLSYPVILTDPRLRRRLKLAISSLSQETEEKDNH